MTGAAPLEEPSELLLSMVISASIRKTVVMSWTTWRCQDHRHSLVAQKALTRSSCPTIKVPLMGMYDPLMLSPIGAFHVPSILP